MFLLQTSRGVIRTSVFECPISKQFWSDLGSHIFDSANVVHSFSLKDIIFYYDNAKNKPLEHFLFYMVHFSFTNINVQLVTHPIPFLKLN